MPLNSSGSPRSRARAYEKQSPMLSRAGCPDPRPKRWYASRAIRACCTVSGTTSILTSAMRSRRVPRQHGVPTTIDRRPRARRSWPPTARIGDAPLIARANTAASDSPVMIATRTDESTITSAAPSRRRERSNSWLRYSHRPSARASRAAIARTALHVRSPPPGRPIRAHGFEARSDGVRDRGGHGHAKLIGELPDEPDRLLVLDVEAHGRSLPSVRVDVYHASFRAPGRSPRGGR